MREMSPEVSLVGDDALRKLADVDKEQQEGKDPPHVVTGEMQPGVVMDLDLGWLASPTWQTAEREGGRERRQWQRHHEAISESITHFITMLSSRHHVQQVDSR